MHAQRTLEQCTDNQPTDKRPQQQWWQHYGYSAVGMEMVTMETRGMGNIRVACYNDPHQSSESYIDCSEHQGDATAYTRASLTAMGVNRIV